jgi:tetratricopeptide (TPR) repeat protein
LRRLFALTISIVIALSMILPHAGAMSNTDKDRVSMATERTLNGNAKDSNSYTVNIVGPNNDINITVMSIEFSQKNMDHLDANELSKIVPMYVYLIDIYPDLGNLNIIYENDKGAVDSVYGLRSWAEQVRKDNSGIGVEGYSYNRDDLSNFGAQIIMTDALLAKAKERTAASSYVDQSSALGNQGKYEEALQASEKAIELDPNIAMAWNNKAAALQLLNRTDDALQASEKAIELDPNLALAWNNKGEALKALGNTTEADAAFAKAKELGYTS